MFDNSDKEGGYGWCVTAASFLLHAIVSGVTYSCGVFHLIFRNYFNKPTHFVTSWISAVMLAMCVLAAIPGTLLTYKLGYRFTVIIGGLMAAGGMAASGFCTEYYQVLLAFGALTGIGFGLALTPSIMVIEQYFYMKRSVAVTFAVAGSGLGVTLIPIAAYHLEENLAWKGMALVFTGICLNICLCGAAMKPKDHQTTRQRRGILKIFEPGLCHSAAFVALCVVNFLWSFGSVILYMYLPGYAIKVGETVEDAIILVGVVGVTTFIARPTFKLFTHSAKLDHISIFLCTFVMAGILTGLHTEMFKHKAGQIGYAIIFGMHSGFWTTFVAFLPTELIGDEYVALGRGFTTICIGLGLLGGGPLAGWVLDEMDDDYEIIFYLAGGCMLLSSCILALVNFRKCYFRPMADWCDSDSESSATSSNKPLNTCNAEELVYLASEATPLSTHAVLPCFSDTGISRNNDQHPDRHRENNEDVNVDGNVTHTTKENTLPCFTESSNLMVEHQNDVTLRGRNSMLEVPDLSFRLSSIDRSPESDV